MHAVVSRVCSACRVQRLDSRAAAAAADEHINQVEDDVAPALIVSIAFRIVVIADCHHHHDDRRSSIARPPAAVPYIVHPYSASAD